jgi:DNA (cytosine-5)-methyltransferase 1
LTVGLKKAGFRVLAAVEIDRLAAETYRANHPGVVMWRCDIRQLTTAQILKRLKLKPGELDLLAGCPPCQGYSTIRTHNRPKPVEDSRNDLIFDFLRLARGLRPRSIMLENVPGLQDDDRFTTFCEKLGRLGYRCKHIVLDAAEYGVPQRRRRLILLAARRGIISPAPPEMESRHVIDVIGDMPPAGESGDNLHDLPESRTERIRELIANVPKDGGSRKDLGVEFQLECHKRTDGFKDVYGRMAWHDVAPTITGGFVNPSKGRFLHPEEDRTITLREGALLQTFPETYRFSLKRGKFAVAEMIGNALPPEFIARHASQVRAFLLQRRIQAP